MCLSCQFIPPAATPAAKASIRSITVSSVLSVSLKPKGKKKKRHNRKRKIDDDDAGDGVACREDGDDAETEWFKVAFQIALNNCEGKKKRFLVFSDRSCWDSGNRKDAMMEKVQFSIKAKAEEFNLDYAADAGKLYMNEESPWEYLWAYVQGEIAKTNISKNKYAERNLQVLKRKTGELAAKDWIKGEDFSCKQVLYAAKTSVLSALEKSSKKETIKAESILSSIISDLSKKNGLVENQILSDDTKQMVNTANAITKNASLCIKRMTRGMYLGTARLMTGLCAVLAPEIDPKRPNDFSEMLGINHRSKYAKAGIENRALFDEFFELEGDIEIGERVICRGGDDGKLIAIDPDGSVTIQLHPWNTQVKYKTARVARMRRRAPALDGYDREERPDTIPTHEKETINSFFRRHVPISPNKRDIVKRRHKLYPAQQQKKQAMHRYETMDELWAKFKKEHADLGAKYLNEKMPNTCPRILRDNSPWEMRRAHDSSCLCINCEGMNVLRRGVSAACTAIDTIIANAIDSIDNNNDVSIISNDIFRLNEIREIISMPSKYDTIVSCLKPCLSTGELEDANERCINGKDCVRCGFRRLWSNGLRKTLFCEEMIFDEGDTDCASDRGMDSSDGDIGESVDGTDIGGEEGIADDDSVSDGGSDDDADGVSGPTMNTTAPLANAVWTNANIDWRHYTYQTKPTVAAHAQDVARQAAAARSSDTARQAAARSDIDADDGEYSPTANSSARNLCLETTRGTLVDFLDTFEAMTEKHAVHRNLVATERKAQLNYDRNVRPLIMKRDIDFSENGSIKDKRQAQSQYWVTIQYTLFVSITSWLLATPKT